MVLTLSYRITYLCRYALTMTKIMIIHDHLTIRLTIPLTNQNNQRADEPLETLSVAI